MDIYDRILKENAAAFLPTIITKVLGISVKSFRILPTEMNVTLSKRTDIPCLIETNEGEILIVHVEFQSGDDPDMPFRMNMYKAILVNEYRLKVRQIVIHFGEGKPNMETKLPDGMAFESFELVHWHGFPYQQFLDSDNPELIILALLADFGNENPQKIIEEILQKIISSEHSENERRKWLEHLLVLARLRKLVPLTKKLVSAMPIVFDITTDELYLEGRVKGRTEGLEEGLEKGLEKGIRLELKRGEMTLREIADYFEVSIAFVQAVRKRMGNDAKK
jgi:predicted transposase YdaD